jgi:predicted tellurium resistance membrane protein TerC
MLITLLFVSFALLTNRYRPICLYPDLNSSASVLLVILTRIIASLVFGEKKEDQKDKSTFQL